MKSLLRMFLSRNTKIALKKVYYFGSKFQCNVCKSNVRFFKQAGYDSEVLKKYEIVGGGTYQNDVCPVCRSSYRERLLKLYFDSINFFDSRRRILHFAPERNIGYFLQKLCKEDYIPCDINPGRYIHVKNVKQVDILDIPFEDNSFDHVICNHVLEHIENDTKAMSGIFRVLKPGGFAVLQVPMSFKIKKSIEDSSVQSEEERFEIFGQKDHVRIYAYEDYINRLESVGFNVKTIEQEELRRNNKASSTKLALHPKERIIIAEKAEC